MSWILQIVVFLMKTLFYQHAFRQAKKTGLLTYLKILQVTRKSLILAVFLFFFLQMMFFGFIGLVVTGVWLWPTDDLHLKLWVLFGVFSFLFLVPALGLFFIFSDRMWFRLSGAKKMLEEAQT